jgi:hypothetical protein
MTISRLHGLSFISNLLDPDPWRRIVSRKQALQRILTFQPQLQSHACSLEAIQACQDWYFTRDVQRQPVFAPGPWVAWDMTELANIQALRVVHLQSARDLLAQWFIAEADLQTHWRFLLKQQLRWSGYSLVHPRTRIWTPQEIATAGLAEMKLAA